MSRFAIRTPYLIVVVCLIIAILGIVSVLRMPVDLFPAMNIPVVAVATFYSGMPRSRSKATSPTTWNGSSRWPAGSITWNRDPWPA